MSLISTSNLMRSHILIGLILIAVSTVSAIYASLQMLHFLWQVELSFGAYLLTEAAHQTYVDVYAATSASLGVALTGGLTFVFPSHTNYVDSLRNWRPRDLRKLLAIMVLSGGTVYAKRPSYKYCVRYYGKDIMLHTLFCNLVKRIHGIRATPAQWRSKGSYVTQVYSKTLVNDLLTLSPSYTTRNGNGNNHQLHDGHHLVSASFLFNSSQKVIRESVRLASSSNGGLYCTVERRCNDHKYFVRPRFALGYLSPPNLLDDYKQILKQIGIETSPIFDKRYEMKGFLLSNSWDTVERFTKIGGFIEGVKINRGRYKRMERNSLLRGAMSFHRYEDNTFDTQEDAVETIQEYIIRAHLARLTKRLYREGYLESDADGATCGYKLNEKTCNSLGTFM